MDRSLAPLIKGGASPPGQGYVIRWAAVKLAHVAAVALVAGRCR